MLLPAALDRARAERNAAEGANPGTHRPRGPANRSIPRPRNMATVTVRSVREHLGLAGTQNDQRWTDIRAEMRRYMDAGLLDLTIGWKEQESRRLGKVYDAIEEMLPELKRFRAQWATEFLVHESFGAQKTYRNCKNKEGTYRARHRQKSQLARMCEMIWDENEDGYLPPTRHKGTGPRAPCEFFSLPFSHFVHADIA
ncbi:hypothetical protein B0H17DRAFT_1071499 [Mycena rosella]|uniref:Uncharacterized protein n=1 Tax=Mycena rosella TaxID=1033263 RepID=A0AAD7DAG3_MYCRO|nr:hypothetical protein B0H17DRAFT_1071499 [Mycena rosella]